MERKNYMGRTMREVLHPQLAEQFETAITKVIKTGKPEFMEYPSIKPGTDDWYHAKLTCSPAIPC